MCRACDYLVIFAGYLVIPQLLCLENISNKKVERLQQELIELERDHKAN